MSAVDNDFGRGLYTTTLERQARQWAWERFYKWQAENPRKSGNQPVILRFRVRRFSDPNRPLTESLAAHDGLDRLRSLQFVRGHYFDLDYWSFVQHCRQSTVADIRNHGCAGNSWYQMVCGPVAAFWTQRVAMADSDQFSFHDDGIDLLNALIDRGDPDYRWSVIT